MLTKFSIFSILSIFAFWPFSSPLKKEKLEHQGYRRVFHFYVPDKLVLKNNPSLLFVLHGGGGTGPGLAKMTRYEFNQIADEHGFIVVYPSGIDRSWNDGRRDWQSGAASKQIDDLGYFQKIIDYFEDKYSINTKNVFMTGISNGGLMSFYTACKAPGMLSAIAPVTAQIGKEIEPLCNHPMKIGLALFNGTSDPLVPYNGGQVIVFGKARGLVNSTESTLKIWIDNNECKKNPEITELADLDKDDDSQVEILRYGKCRFGGEVLHYKIKGGGHTWPGGKQYLPKKLIGNVNMDINSPKLIWEYFSAFEAKSGN